MSPSPRVSAQSADQQQPAAQDADELHSISFSLNGTTCDVATESRWSLVDVLREEVRLTGSHVGCEQGVCGSCTVLLDGRPVRACLVYGVQADGAEVVTIEGALHEPIVARLQEEFVRHRALQCGFCTSGFIMLAAGLLRDTPRISDGDLRHGLSSNICRCTGYTPIFAAVRTVRDELIAADEAAS